MNGNGLEKRDSAEAIAWIRKHGLAGAILRHTDLTNADLWCANLTGANLCRAELDGADLTGARWSEATLWPAGVGVLPKGDGTEVTP